MRRTAALVVLAGALLVSAPVHAQQVTLAQLVELFIEFGIIAPERAETARQIVENFGEDATVATDEQEETAGLQKECAAVVLTRNLGPGTQHKQVELLQAFLAEFPQWYPEGLVTGYYGPLTQRAVERYQTDQQIVWSGTPATTGFGNAGPKTRASLRECHDRSTGDHPAQRGGSGRAVTIADILEEGTYDGFLFEADPDPEFQPAFFEQYGRYTHEIFNTYPALIQAIQSVIPDFSRLDMSYSSLNRAASPADNRTMLVLEGCSTQACDATLYTLIYDFTPQSIYALKEEQGASGSSYTLYGRPDAVAREVLFTAYLRSRQARQEEGSDQTQTPPPGGSTTSGTTSGLTTGGATTGGSTTSGATTGTATTGGTTTGGTTTGGTTGSGGSVTGTSGAAPPPPPPPPPPAL